MIWFSVASLSCLLGFFNGRKSLSSEFYSTYLVLLLWQGPCSSLNFSCMLYLVSSLFSGQLLAIIKQLNPSFYTTESIWETALSQTNICNLEHLPWWLTLRDIGLKSLCIGDFGISLSIRREMSVISVGVLWLKAAEMDIGWIFLFV